MLFKGRKQRKLIEAGNAKHAAREQEEREHEKEREARRKYYEEQAPSHIGSWVVNMRTINVESIEGQTVHTQELMEDGNMHGRLRMFIEADSNRSFVQYGERRLYMDELQPVEKSFNKVVDTEKVSW